MKSHPRRAVFAGWKFMRTCRLAADPRNSLVTETVFLHLEAVLDRVTGHRLWPGWVGHGSVWQTRRLTQFFVTFACILLLPLGREYAILESVGFCVLCNFTSPCLLAQILVICYFLVVYHSVTARKFHLLGCSVYSCLFMPHTQWLGRVTGSKAMGRVG